MSLRHVTIVWTILAAGILAGCGLTSGSPEKDVPALLQTDSNPRVNLPTPPGPTPEPHPYFSPVCVAFYSFDAPTFNPTAPNVSLFDPKHFLLRAHDDWHKVTTGVPEECDAATAPSALSNIPTYAGARPNGVPTSGLPANSRWYFQGGVFNGLVALAETMNYFDTTNPPSPADHITLPVLRSYAPYIDAVTGCAISLAIQGLEATTLYTDPSDPTIGEYRLGGLISILISRPDATSVTQCAGFALDQGTWNVDVTTL